MTARIQRIIGKLGHERLTIRTFPTRDAMHKFLNTGANGVVWRESDKDFAAGTYAFAGGKWHNVKSLDPMMLAHC